MLKKILYFNRNDPQAWVYRHEKYKAIGVTFNFAKAASWIWLTGLIGFLLVFQWGVKRFCHDCTAYEFLAVFVVLCPLLIVTCFWMATRDLKRHPGLQSVRPEKDELPEHAR